MPPLFGGDHEAVSEAHSVQDVDIVDLDVEQDLRNASRSAPSSGPRREELPNVQSFQNESVQAPTVLGEKEFDDMVQSLLTCDVLLTLAAFASALILATFLGSRVEVEYVIDNCRGLVMDGTVETKINIGSMVFLDAVEQQKQSSCSFEPGCVQRDEASDSGFLGFLWSGSFMDLSVASYEKRYSGKVFSTGVLLFATVHILVVRLRAILHAINVSRDESYSVTESMLLVPLQFLGRAVMSQCLIFLFTSLSPSPTCSTMWISTVGGHEAATLWCVFRLILFEYVWLLLCTVGFLVEGHRGELRNFCIHSCLGLGLEKAFLCLHSLEYVFGCTMLLRRIMRVDVAVGLGLHFVWYFELHWCLGLLQAVFCVLTIYDLVGCMISVASIVVAATRLGRAALRVCIGVVHV
mmetsp:Transcript_27749/g.64122  ORF Transcript_27749/g.64122 Transcript_27749/m.64122 type:complete len:408 (-) Transcript_27749:12-1235(-)